MLQKSQYNQSMPEIASTQYLWIFFLTECRALAYFFYPNAVLLLLILHKSHGGSYFLCKSNFHTFVGSLAQKGTAMGLMQNEKQEYDMLLEKMFSDDT